VGRPHGLDGAFAVLEPQLPLEVGTAVTVAGGVHEIERRAGTRERPLVRLAGIEDRGGAAALGGELLLVAAELGAGEWVAEDLIGCRIEGLGQVRRVLAGSSCDLLELTDGVLVPLVGDAVKEVDTVARRIEVDRDFLGLDESP
jgi:ribosomal 30S subunit maturation factor RimM